MNTLKRLKMLNGLLEDGHGKVQRVWKLCGWLVTGKMYLSAKKWKWRSPKTPIGIVTD